jgi:hypothetical protein
VRNRGATDIREKNPKEKARQHEQNEVQQLPGDAEPYRRRRVCAQW